MPKNRLNPEKLIEAVWMHLAGQGSMQSHANTLGIKANQFYEWVVKYETFGSSGLLPGKILRYSAEIKQEAVREFRE